jgi:hypothetical protein
MQLVFLHTTVADNAGNSGVHVGAEGAIYSSVTMTNSILSGHSIGVIVDDGCTLSIDGVLWYNTSTAIAHSAAATVDVRNQYAGDPAFVDPANGDYHLAQGSAAIGKALPTNVSEDIDGDDRPFQSTPDLGADEWSALWLIYLPLVQRNDALK